MATGPVHPRSSKARECCIHQAIHSRKMEGIHQGDVAPRPQPAGVTAPKAQRRS